MMIPHAYERTRSSRQFVTRHVHLFERSCALMTTAQHASPCVPRPSEAEPTRQAEISYAVFCLKKKIEEVRYAVHTDAHSIGQVRVIVFVLLLEK
eukprot:NODE_26843_length_535_cov_14.019608.p2 GENE.NODE_26843_length_535_cov_14.019608~~NODE_26843_length_535_cov_14.019608.p2  ORF type:complete len:95 (-),score=2.16 NODE_26843_length_535_cov_14.019608:26-310(-)